ncbi:unnamed protein product [Macrosiphum euphorbiae]|uniref:Uncharacterized protein n=1 Tax=Macrosiphum euphorbiae TaxID=13131 RepID=A0AAV0W5U1_9HEMI|nr:unnamed protein product [Macrosiphum euphorbiae]
MALWLCHGVFDSLAVDVVKKLDVSYPPQAIRGLSMVMQELLVARFRNGRFTDRRGSWWSGLQERLVARLRNGQFSDRRWLVLLQVLWFCS